MTPAQATAALEKAALALADAVNANLTEINPQSLGFQLGGLVLAVYEAAIIKPPLSADAQAFLEGQTQIAASGAPMPPADPPSKVVPWPVAKRPNLTVVQ